VSEPTAAIRVVIADDAVGLRGLLRAVLTRQPGFEVVGEAGNGAEAVVEVGRTRPDVVLLDLAMPVMDGLEAIPKISGLSPRTRVVVLSGFEAAQMEQEARALGAHAYLTKGLSPAELVAALRHAVDGRDGGAAAPPEALEDEDRETLLQSEDRFRLLVDEVVDYAIVMLDAEGRVASWNTGARRITGYAASDVLGRHLGCFYPGDAGAPLAEADLGQARRAGRLETEGLRRRADGSHFWAACVVTAMREPGAGLRGYAVVFHDISGRREAEQALATMASTDPLTGLPNRREFESRLAAVGRRRYSMLAIDLDNLKALNDGYGHETGDEALRVTARALRLGMREADVVARVGGDEFAALLPDLGETEALAAAERLRLALHGVSLQRGQARISVGVASGDGGADPAQVWAAADEALYAAKTAGRDRSEVSPTGMVAGRHRGTTAGWGPRLEGLVASGGMLTVFQPVVDLTSGRIAGFEALGRPAGDDLEAGVEPLFAAADRLGYGRDLDWLCRRVALQEARLLPPGSTLFVNVGVSALLDPVHDVDQMLLLVGWAGRHPCEVVLEITEREAVLDTGRLCEVLRDYRAHGFRFAVDDVGDGHSTLELLAAAVPEFLKISGRITRSAAEVGPRSAIRAIVAFADQSRARVVAEGIETPADLQRMRELGIELGQGFGLRRPAVAAAWSPARG
jgi:diguanylate cyclase (GGDEF)-like protein/PAS domain S-box-containing protein